MKFKIDTKEKLVIFSPETAVLDANMAASLREIILADPVYAGQNLVLDLSSVTSATPEGVEAILAVYRHAYGHGHSCCLTGVTPALVAQLEAAHPDFLNITPTLSEAIDIVMMEELERELRLEDDDLATSNE
ncbi:MAG TPA: STAS domain-containing protein [Chitinophaga sp.]